MNFQDKNSLYGVLYGLDAMYNLINNDDTFTKQVELCQDVEKELLTKNLDKAISYEFKDGIIIITKPMTEHEKQLTLIGLDGSVQIYKNKLKYIYETGSDKTKSFIDEKLKEKGYTL